MEHEGTQSESASHKERVKNRILKPGESLGNFRVVKCMCSSLLANYYHMQHVRDLHDVTVCVFHPRTIADPKLLKRLEGLQAAVKTIDHEGVPKIQDCAVVDDRHCVFMDLVEGQSLSQYFAEHATPGEVGLNLEGATRIVARLLGLLGYAHAQGVDHRDMDTDLIFIQSDGSVRMLGLGLKAALGGELFESIVSASVSPLVANEAPARLNSFDVMSPEYRRGIPEDSRVDIYALGYIAYWLLTGAKANLADCHAPSALVPALPKAWDTLIETALKRSNEERYQSCKGALIALKATEESESEEFGLTQGQIDRIPVPKGIVDRGELATRIYRLAVIGLVGVTLTALAASYMKDAFIEDEVEAPKLVSVAGGEIPANFSLNVVPEGARVQFVDVDGGVFRARAGGLDLVLLPGSYDVRISAPSYMDEQLSVTMANVALPKVNVALKPALKDLEILTEPNATIALRDDEDLEVDLGLTGADGVFHLKRGVFDGSFRVVVKKVGYSTQVLEDLSGEQLQVSLEALPSSLTVRTQPAGARILVNNVEVGRSPITIDATEESGNYTVAVHYNGYRSVGRRIHVDTGEHEIVDFGALTGRSSALDFTVSFEDASEEEVATLMADLEVEINEQRFPYGAEALQTLPEGAYQVRLLHPLYITELQSVTVEDRVDQTLSYSMSPLPGRVEFALPEGVDAEVRVNGVRANLGDGGVQVDANERVEIELRLKDYLTMVRRFELKPNGRVVWDVEPVPIPGPEVGAGWTVPYLAMKLSWIVPGGFSMGSPMQESGRLPNEGPQGSVRFSQGFWAGANEVTQGQYFKVMGEKRPSSLANAASPVSHVAWEDAKLYCQRLTSQEQAAGRLPDGYVYRLPTEAEWEYLARAGTVSPFAFGDRADASNGNFRGSYPVDGEYGAVAPDHYGALPVGSYAPNGFGLYDVHGNVAEWTLDRYNGRLPGGSRVDPEPRAEGRRVTARGGSWKDFAVRVRCAARDEVRPDTKSDAIGFRVVLVSAY